MNHFQRFAVIMRLVVAGTLSLASPFLALAQEPLAVPALTGHVVDTTGTLTAAQTSALEDKLRGLEAAKGSQVVILIVPTVQPEDIASYANRVGNTWKIGRKEVGDGVLLVLAKEDRKVRIEVAKTLEGAIPDLAAKRIISESMTPLFKTGDYAGGLSAAVDHITARINGEVLPDAPAAGRTGGLTAGLNGMDLAIFLFFVVPIGGAIAKSIFGQKLGSLVTGGGVGLLAFLLTTSVLVAGVAGIVALLFVLFSGLSMPAARRGGRGGFSGGFGGGGGGFSSGGGGDFGGGGASGNW